MGLSAIETEIKGSPESLDKPKRERIVFILRVDDEGHDLLTHEKISGKKIDEIRGRDGVYAIRINTGNVGGQLVPEKTIFIGDGEILAIKDAAIKDQFWRMRGAFQDYLDLGITQVVSLKINGINRVRPFRPGDVLVARPQKKV